MTKKRSFTRKEHIKYSSTHALELIFTQNTQNRVAVHPHRRVAAGHAALHQNL